MAGFFVVVEGTDGVGKSTLIDYIKCIVTDQGIADQFVFTREPGGTLFAEDVRRLLFNNELSAFSEVMLIQAARDDHMNKVIRPALEAGKIVVCDRFIHSTYAYNILPSLIGKDESVPDALTEIFNYSNATLLMGIGEPFTVIVGCDAAVQMERIKAKDLNRLDERYLESLELINKFYTQSANTPNCYHLDNSGDLHDNAKLLLKKILEQKEHFDKFEIKPDDAFSVETTEVNGNDQPEFKEPETPQYTLDDIKTIVKEQALSEQYVGSLNTEREFIEKLFDYYVDKIEAVLNTKEDTLLNGKSIPQLVQQIQSIVYFGHQFMDLKKGYLEEEITSTQVANE